MAANSIHTHSAIDQIGFSPRTIDSMGAVPVQPAHAQQPSQPAVAKERSAKVPSHIPALDGIRGLAVVLVLFCHATGRPFGHDANDFFNGPIDKLILILSRLSWTGVDLFFVLSGFLITGILFDAKGKDHFFRNFYARRTVRIFPLYYAFLILFLVIWPMLPAALSKGFGTIYSSHTWYWLYLSNYSQSITEQAGHITDHVVHVSWSLSIEEQFYLCWPLVVFLADRKTLLKICVGMFFGSMALRTFFLWQGNYYYSIGFTPCRVDGLAVGAAIALIARGPAGLKSLVKMARWVGPASGVLVLAIIIGMQMLGYRRGIGQSPGYIMFGTALFALLFGSVLVLAASAEKGTFFNRLFTNPVLTIYGKYSYAVYLLHLPIMVLVSEYLFRPDRFRIGPTMLPGLLLFYGITWSLALLAGIISWNVLEKHCLKLKDYFPMEKKASTAAAWEGADVAKAEQKA